MGNFAFGSKKKWSINKFHPLSQQSKLVFGFCRIYCHQVFPDSLKDICFRMLHIIDEWNKKLINPKSYAYAVKFNDLLPGSLKTFDMKSNVWQSIFGSIMIEKDQTFEWNLKILNIVYESHGWHEFTNNIMFGIIEINENMNVADLHSVNGRHEFWGACKYEIDFFVISSMAGKFCRDKRGIYEPHRDNYGYMWSNQDTITMRLDLTKTNGSLSFLLNGKDQGTAFDKIDVNKKYCMILCCQNNAGQPRDEKLPSNAFLLK